MKRTIGLICATALVGTTLAIGTLPANAASANARSSDYLQLVQARHGGPHGFERRGDYAYYNGHRGYHTRHPGYRQYNGYWFPPAAFVGAAIGGAIANGLMNNPPGEPGYGAYDSPYDDSYDGSPYDDSPYDDSGDY